MFNTLICVDISNVPHKKFISRIKQSSRYSGGINYQASRNSGDIPYE